MTGRLDGKVVLLTGVASGMGRVTARLFAQEGATVVGGDIGPYATNLGRRGRMLVTC